MLKTASAAIALLALANPALINDAWAAGCATPVEAAALKTAVIQQELMVAALQCHETAAYNRFVLSYRGELQDSDATLKTFFIRRGGEHGEAGYDTFKTKAANLSALEQARNARAFCADAHALFAAAFAHQGSLMSFVETRAGGTDIGGICAESRPVLAKTDVVPVPRVETVKIAASRPAETAVGGVPVHSLPAFPYRGEEPPLQARNDTLRNDTPPTEATRNDVARDARDDDADDDAAPAYANDEDLPPPPPRPRYYDIRDRGYRYAPQNYGQWYSRNYGPPPGWRQDWRDYPPPPPPPRYGWYPRSW
jgi:hypothetical protein